MESLDITKTDKGFHIEGFPEAVKVLALSGPKAKRLSDLALHRADLNFASECLAQINSVAETPHILRQALWRSAVVHFVKCFGVSNSRFSLNSKTIYRGDAEGLAVFEYFFSLRNKHMVHDENSYAQCLPGAILNKKEMDHKIAKIICLSMIGDTLVQESYSNLHLLIMKALNWVATQFDELCDELTSELESKPYDELFGMNEIVWSKPDADAVHGGRKRSI